MLPPNIISPLLSPFIYTKACHDLLDTGQYEAGTEGLKNAIPQWPEYWLS